MKRSFFRWFLISLLLFNALGAYYGSFMLITDPTGTKLKAPSAALEGTMFNDFLIPGIILLVVNGILPTMAAWGMITKKPIKPLPGLYWFSSYHWAWSLSLISGIGLFIWIVAQIGIIGYWNEPPIQLIYGILSVTIIYFSILPSVRRSYNLKS